jgi:hypothetical protein
MVSKYKLILLLPFILTSCYLFGNVTYADDTGGFKTNVQMNDTTNVVNHTDTIVRQTNSNSIVFNVQINKVDVPISNVASTSISSQEPCYLWSSAGSTADVAEQLFLNNVANQAGATIDELNKEMINQKIAQYKDVVASFENGDKTDEEKAAMITEVYSNAEHFTLSSNDESQHIANIKGDTEYMWKFFKYHAGSMNDEEKEEFKAQRNYMMMPNPKAYDDFGANKRCGPLLADGTGFMFVAQKPIAGDYSDGAIKSVVKNTENSSIVKINIRETGERTYRADISYNGAKISNPNTIGMAPYNIKSITYVWGLRVPSTLEPLSKTTIASEIGIQPQPPTKNDLTFEGVVNGKLATTNLATQLKIAFSDSHVGDGSTQSGNTIYHLNADRKFLDDETRADMIASLKAEKDTVALLKNKISDSYVFEPVRTKNKTGGNYMKVDEKNNSMTFNDLDALHDTYTIPQGVEGKYNLVVYAIINGEYMLYDDPEGSTTSTFTYPLGFVSASETILTNQCGQLNAEFVDFSGDKVTDSLEAVNKLQDQVCEDVSWVGPKAIAKISTDANGKVELDGSKSTGTLEIITKYDFTAETKTECTDWDDKNNCVLYEEFYTGTAKRNKIKETTIEHPIVSYTWSKNYRVYNKTLDEYEIELKNESSKAATRSDAILHKGNTFACLLVQTNAPRDNVDGNSNGKLRKDGQDASIIGFDAYSKMDKIKQIQEQKIASCDYILTNDESNLIKENW